METYDEILSKMTEKYKELSGITPHEASDTGIRLRVLAGEIFNSLVNMEWLKNQMFADTATGEYLDYHGAERGLERRAASCAQGSVIFSVSQAALSDVVIPAGTVVATEGEEPLRFETTQEVTLYAGDLSVYADIIALTTGRAGNAAAGKITVIVTPPSGDLQVTNPDPCESGSDTESDESFRSRIISSFANASNGTNCAYYERVATEISGVASAGVVPRGRGAGTVDVYVASQGTDVSDEVLAVVQETLSRLREVNVDVAAYKAQKATIHMRLNLEVKPGYEFEEVKEQCIEALSEYISSRGVGGNVLLTEAGERIYHIDGVKEYSFSSYANSDSRCGYDYYPVPGSIRVVEGIE